MLERPVVVAAAPPFDALEGGGGTSAAVDGDGGGVALRAPGLLHATVYGTSGFKACTVYGVPMERTLGDPKREAKMPAGWRTAKLCSAGCDVPTGEVHPGLHVGKEPVCALPEGHAGHHYCFPADKDRYALCPDCKKLIAKRVIARHVKACGGFGVDGKLRKDQEALVLADYLEARVSQIRAWEPWKDPKVRAKDEQERQEGRGFRAIERTSFSVQRILRWTPGLAQNVRNHKVAHRGKWFKEHIERGNQAGTFGGDWGSIGEFGIEPLTHDPVQAKNWLEAHRNPGQSPAKGET